MDARAFVSAVGSDFYTGVPDSQLKALCDYLYSTYGIDSRRHVVCANEGNCVGLAAGYHLSTGKVPAVYLQNSGEGNIINPLASLMNDEVYAIPCVFIIGWRGEPGVHDEPQHIFQGKATLPLLDAMDVEYMVVGPNTAAKEVSERMSSWSERLSAGKQVAFVIKKGALSFAGATEYGNGFAMNREEVVGRIAEAAGDGMIVSTTGKISRELFEYRAARGQGHGHDFLSVGSMGHCSSIALGVAVNTPGRKVWCIDGDGSALMHLGALCAVASASPPNLVHIVLNNSAHETVGGMPTAAPTVNLAAVAKACGYPKAVRAENSEELEAALERARHSDKLFFIEVGCALGSRKDLGRPTTTAVNNKKAFMAELSSGGGDIQ